MADHIFILYYFFYSSEGHTVSSSHSIVLRKHFEKIAYIWDLLWDSYLNTQTRIFPCCGSQHVKRTSIGTHFASLSF